jgi:hypothetical protein
MPLPLFCEASGCDHHGEDVSFQLLVPVEMSQTLAWTLRAQERAQDRGDREEAIRTAGAAIKAGAVLVTLCPLHLQLLRDDRLEWIQKGQRLVLWTGSQEGKHVDEQPTA